MEIWSHDDKLYEVVSFYAVPDDAWYYELTGPSGTGPNLCVAIPDATPDGPFTPRPARYAVVHAGGGTVPWPILHKLVDLLDTSGDLVDEQGEPADFPLTHNHWENEDRRYQANTYHLGDADAWCYELFEVKPPDGTNIYLDVRVPDAAPESGPFIPGPADLVTLTMHGNWTIPWPIFRRFINAIQASGDIVSGPQ